MGEILILGDNSQSGAYILRIRVSQTIRLAFGRFKKGKLITLPAGEYVYVGSAMSEKGATSLARRLIRHATRSGNNSPHDIRPHMLGVFESAGLGVGDLLPRNGKKLHWNVDHLLDQDSVELAGVIAIRSTVRLESRIAHLLESEPCTTVIEKGLGANDTTGATHLLRIECGEAWWSSLPGKINHLSFSKNRPTDAIISSSGDIHV